MSAGRLILMGSGETSNRLVAAHRLGIERAGARRVLVLDTPYGFQENAALISERLTGFFRSSLRVEAEAVSYRSAEEGQVACERMLAAVRRARYVFAGPGSPTYALGVWKGTPLASQLRALLSDGATVTLASAASLTGGLRTLPVYDIYKVGAEPGWMEGLDLTSHLGLGAVFVPHWNNTEGQGFDTSRCYMGRRRFRRLRSMLPEGMGVVGIDEHTAAVIDFGEGQLTAMGVGGVTLCGREETVLADGETADLGVVLELLNSHRPAAHSELPECPADLPAALAGRSAGEVARALLEAESKASGGSEAARRSLRSMLLAVSDLAVVGLKEPAEWVGEYIDLLVNVRASLRSRGDWEEADRIRSGLHMLGVTLRDTPSGTKWTLAHPESGKPSGPNPAERLMVSGGKRAEAR